MHDRNSDFCIRIFVVGRSKKILQMGKKNAHKRFSTGNMQTFHYGFPSLKESKNNAVRLLTKMRGGGYNYYA